MKRIYSFLLSMIVFVLANSANREPVVLGFLTSPTNMCEIIRNPEVDRFFNVGSVEYVSGIKTTKNCYLTSSGIMVGNASAGGELSFMLSQAYRDTISRIFLQCIVPGNQTPVVSVNGVSKIMDAEEFDVGWINFDVDIAQSAGQPIYITATSKVILVGMTLIYSGSEAATGKVESITVPVKTRSMNVGEESLIHSIVSPYYAVDKSLSYSSSNEGVASVDGNGLIHANKIGTADITVSSASTPDVRTTIVVEVVEIHPVSIEFIGSDRVVGVGGTLKFELAFSPENAVKDVEWSTNYGEYFDLDQNGVIKAKKEIGAANVKVTSKVDNNVYKYCAFRIVDNLPVETISVSPEEVDLEVGEKIQAKAIVSPQGASLPVVGWESSDPTIAKVESDGTIIGISQGSCHVYAMAGDAENKVTTSIPVSVVSYELSTIEPISTVSDEIVLEFDNKMLRISGYKIGEWLHIFDMNGRCISVTRLMDPAVSVSLSARQYLVLKIGNSAYKVY